MTVDEFWSYVEGQDPTRMGKDWQVGQASEGLASAVVTGAGAAVDEFCDGWAAYMEEHTRARVASFLEGQMSRAEVEAMRRRAHVLAADMGRPGSRGRTPRWALIEELRKSVEE